MANKTTAMCKIAEPVEIHWKDRYMVTDAMVLDEMDEVLSGTIPFEGLDVIVDLGNKKLIGAHGDKAVCRVQELENIVVAGLAPAMLNKIKRGNIIETQCIVSQ